MNRLDAFRNQPDVSARSLLITIFGDSIVPAGGRVWLSDIISLGEVFGFSERLIRTSMYRLTQDGWFATTKVGRRSHYELTERAQREFSQAECQIYHPTSPEWDGRWAMCLVRMSKDDSHDGSSFSRELAANGFGELTPGVWVSPLAAGSKWLGTTSAPTASVSFGNLDELRSSEEFANSFDLVELGKKYQQFTDAWGGMRDQPVGDDETAFGLRTILIHEFRRIRLSHLDLPIQLHPDGWPGQTANDLANELYTLLSPQTNAWLEQAHSLAAAQTGRFGQSDGRPS